MSASPPILVLWLVGLAWGALAAAPVVARARRQPVDRRLRPLQPTRDAPARTQPRLLGRVLAPLSAGVVGRVLAGARSRLRAGRDAAALGAELPVTLDLLGVAVGAGCTPESRDAIPGGAHRAAMSTAR